MVWQKVDLIDVA